MKMQLAAGLVVGSMTIGAVAQAQETITAVHAFPETLIYTQSFLSFVDKVNEAGAGVVQIEVRGGPEAIGMFQPPDAVRDGRLGAMVNPEDSDALIEAILSALKKPRAIPDGLEHFAIPAFTRRVHRIIDELIGPYPLTRPPERRTATASA